MFVAKLRGGVDKLIICVVQVYGKTYGISAEVATTVRVELTIEPELKLIGFIGGVPVHVILGEYVLGVTL